MTMPDMNGDQVFQEMRRLRPDIRIVLISGCAEQEVVERFADEAPSGFIHKPYTHTELVTQMDRALSHQDWPCRVAS